MGTRTFAYRDDEANDGDLQLKTEDMGTQGGDLYSRLITRKYAGTGGGHATGTYQGFEIGDSQDPDADYDTGYWYNGARLHIITGPGLSTGGVVYNYAQGTGDFVQWISYWGAGGQPQIRTALAYETDRDLLASVEHIRDPHGTPATISKYAYVNDAAGRRTRQNGDILLFHLLFLPFGPFSGPAAGAERGCDAQTGGGALGPDG